MGGYAALRIAFKRPELFAAIATHSAMLLLEIPSEAAGARRGHMRAFGSVFGNPISQATWRRAMSADTRAPSRSRVGDRFSRNALRLSPHRREKFLKRRCSLDCSQNSSDSIPRSGALRRKTSKKQARGAVSVG